jgi:benzoyl-CoA-dihydrodiol lyase
VITFDRTTQSYRHWRLSVEGRVATLTLDVDEDAGLTPGYKLKLNSYDLGVDIELNDALQRIRFEHPAVACVVITSAKARMFCAGANIYMLGASSHGWKVNFCKFTNETRNGLEDSSRHDGLRFIAALNGATAGGGYEIALACDEIVMIDDRSTAVSLPEVPLLGVLPGTGGLTRLVDKRKVRSTHRPSSGSLVRSIRIASSSSRATASGHHRSAAASIARRSLGCGPAGAETVSMARRASRSNTTSTWP